MRYTVRSLLMVAALGLSPAACSHSPKGSQAAQEELPVTVRVENQSFNDMTIYVIAQSSQRVRLGLANGNSTVKFRVPRSMVFGLTQLQFQAHPIGGNRNPISESVTVSPGDEIQLVIPPSV